MAAYDTDLAYVHDVGFIGELYRRRHEIHVLRLYPPAELAGVLRAVGFRLRWLKSYGGDPFPRGLTGFMARKPG